MKKFIILILFLCSAIFLFPFFITSIFNSSPDSNLETDSGILFSEPYIVSLRLIDQNQTISINFEDYISGIVALEMPPTNNSEALKAQAVAARSFILNKISDYSNNNISPFHEGAVLCNDFSHCNAWASIDTTASNWNEQNVDAYKEKIISAVYDTKGEYLAYDNKIATAFYHKISHGKTESSYDIWGVDRPHLKSVSSDFDTKASGFNSRVFYPEEAFFTVLSGLRPNLFSKDFWHDKKCENITYTSGGSIATIQICGETFTGLEIANAFKLKSTCFTLTFDNSKVVFDVKGNGHCVGMSQFGANAMAENGSNYKEILNHYYTDTTISSLYHIS